jgi:hypothetical protein
MVGARIEGVITRSGRRPRRPRHDAVYETVDEAVAAVNERDARFIPFG